MTDPSREGFEFVGWYQTSEGANQKLEDELVKLDSTEFTEDTTLYAGWKKVEKPPVEDPDEPDEEDKPAVLTEYQISDGVTDKIVASEIYINGKRLMESEKNEENIKLIVEPKKELPFTLLNPEVLSGRDNYFYDIYFKKNNTILDGTDMNAMITITVPGKRHLEVKVYVVDETNAGYRLSEIVPVYRNGDDITFRAPHFSYYVLSFAKAQVKLDSPTFRRGLMKYYTPSAVGKSKTSTRLQTPVEVKVDSAKLPTTDVVTTIPATGENRVPMPYILTLLGAALILLILRKKR